MAGVKVLLFSLVLPRTKLSDPSRIKLLPQPEVEVFPFLLLTISRSCDIACCVSVPWHHVQKHAV